MIVQFVLGRRTKHQATLDGNISNAIYNLSKEFDFPVIQGITMTADDFYEGNVPKRISNDERKLKRE